ncbi:hypothetical protein [Intrasporangium sp. YIM S08009]|uniref:hypothetical protein n=1 Tax=Intrasporangium zincisolvens TaxID=3080018 RepID=UPI002B059905|nr:hypothetical protein [Intrasporangium sp. YIM S08009]
MNGKRMALTGAGIVAAAGIAIGAASLASASGGSDAATGFATNAGYGAVGGEGGQGMPGAGGGGYGNGNTDPSKPMRSDEQLLTGDVAAKVTAAAKAKEPTATIERVETDSDGVYEAHMVRTDGTHIIVQVDKSYAVTNVQVMGQGGSGGPGSRGDGDGDGPHGTGMGGPNGMNGYGQPGGSNGSGGSTGEATPSSTT